MTIIYDIFIKILSYKDISIDEIDNKNNNENIKKKNINDNWIVNWY